MRVRFAPSPTGSLHIGSARTALYNYLFARHSGGSFVLRVDDTDLARSDGALEASILEDLRWLGLAWDEGPDVGGPSGPYRQSERSRQHMAAAEHLLATGQAYRCFCPEERLEELRRAALAEGRTPRYDRRCLALPEREVRRRLDAGEPAAIRFRVPAGEVVVDDLIRGRVVIGADALSDPIIVRSEGLAGYNFASVVDDRDMGITHVIRGDDHLTNTARQQLLFEALGGPAPRWAHHSMVLGRDGGKLSKRHGATAVGDYRDLGYLPEAIVNYLALLGWSHGEDEVLDLDRLVAEFDFAKLSSSPAVFDLAKLDWLDHERIMALAPEEHERRFAERLPAGTPPQAAAALAAAFQPSLVRYGDAPAAAAAVLAPPPAPPDLLAVALAAAPQLTRMRELRAGAPEWLTPAGARDLLATYRAWGKERGIGARDLLMPLRIALTSAQHGPELPFVLAALDRETALSRLDLTLAGNAAGEPTPTPGDQP
ncbi:MAG: glutamate--tRNA ligase [Actinobacteria bacterium]|nr:glutamate--tRNA ligase [Actinomycetota bacterium]